MVDDDDDDDGAVVNTALACLSSLTRGYTYLYTPTTKGKSL